MIPIEGGKALTPPKLDVPVKNEFANVTVVPDEEVLEVIGGVLITFEESIYDLSLLASKAAVSHNSCTEILCAIDADFKVHLNLKPLPLYVPFANV